VPRSSINKPLAAYRDSPSPFWLEKNRIRWRRIQTFHAAGDYMLISKVSRPVPCAYSIYS